MYGHHVPVHQLSNAPDRAQELLNATYRLLSEQTTAINAHIDRRFDHLQQEMAQLRAELVAIKDASETQVKQVSAHLKRASELQVSSVMQFVARLDAFDDKLCGDDSKLFRKMRAIDETLLEVYEKLSDPQASRPATPLRHEVAISPMKYLAPMIGSPYASSDDVPCTVPHFVNVNWSKNFPGVPSPFTPSPSVHDRSPQIPSDGTVDSLRHSVTSLNALTKPAEQAITSPAIETPHPPSPAAQNVSIDLFPSFQDIQTSPGSTRVSPTPIPDLDLLDSSQFFTSPLIIKAEHFADSPLTSISSSDENEVEHMVKPEIIRSSVSPTPLSVRSSPRKPTSKRPSELSPSRRHKRRKTHPDLNDERRKQQQKVRWPAKVEGTNASKKWIECDKCNGWYHYGCVGIQKESKDFTCPPCRAGRRRQRKNKKIVGSHRVPCCRGDCTQRADDDEFFISRIIGRSRDRRTLEGPYMWLVEWDGYAISESTWQHETTLPDPKQLIRQFNKAIRGSGVQDDPDTLLLLPEVQNLVPEALLAQFP